MTDNAKKFLEAVSKDEALKKELMTAKDTEEALTIAKAHGYELKAEDFEVAKMDEPSEDEMEAVAGGEVGGCGCVGIGGGGGAGLACGCLGVGFGKGAGGGCGCFGAGGGGEPD